MSKLPAITGAQAVSAFEKAGFCVHRIRGLHHILKKVGLRYCLSIPVHRGRTLKPALLRRQIRLAVLTEEQFLALL